MTPTHRALFDPTYWIDNTKVEDYTKMLFEYAEFPDEDDSLALDRIADDKVNEELENKNR